MPVLLDVRPYCVPGQNPGAHGSMLEFEKSFKEVRSLIIIVCLPLTSQDYPTIPRHHVVDSGFGSFDRMGDLLESGATATMSMPSNTRKWLWSTLDRGCGIDSGRTAWNPATGLLVNSFKVVSETGKIHQIKTIATGFSVEAPDEEEVAITSVTSIRYHSNFPLLVPDMRSHAHLSHHLLYLTYRDEFQFKVKYKDGSEEWLHGQSFFDEDGTVTDAWLEFVDRDQLENVLKSFTQKQLQEMLSGQDKKATGTKLKCVKRLVKHYIRLKRSEEFALSKLEGRIGPVQHGTESISGVVRTFDTKNYSALDRFDRYWYDITYPTYQKRWEAYMSFSLLHQAVINAFVAYCKLKDTKIKVRQFIRLVIREYEESF